MLTVLSIIGGATIGAYLGLWIVCGLVALFSCFGSEWSRSFSRAFAKDLAFLLVGGPLFR